VISLVEELSVYFAVSGIIIEGNTVIDVTDRAIGLLGGNVTDVEICNNIIDNCTVGVWLHTFNGYTSSIKNFNVHDNDIKHTQYEGVLKDQNITATMTSINNNHITDSCLAATNTYKAIYYLFASNETGLTIMGNQIYQDAGLNAPKFGVRVESYLGGGWGITGLRVIGNVAVGMANFAWAISSGTNTDAYIEYNG
jgi:hypothetical protein